MNIEHAKDEACLQLGSYTSFVELREACENNDTSLSNLIYHMEHAMEIYASQTENKPDAVDFAEWITNNDFVYGKFYNGFGWKTKEQDFNCTLKTTQELYAKFKSPKK